MKSTNTTLGYKDYWTNTSVLVSSTAGYRWNKELPWQYLQLSLAPVLSQSLTWLPNLAVLLVLMKQPCLCPLPQRWGPYAQSHLMEWKIQLIKPEPLLLKMTNPYQCYNICKTIIKILIQSIGISFPKSALSCIKIINYFEIIQVPLSMYQNWFIYYCSNKEYVAEFYIKEKKTVL